MKPHALLKTTNRTTLGVLVISIALTLLLLFHAAGGFRFDTTALVFDVWILLPYLVMLPMLKIATVLWRAFVLLVGAVLMAAMGAMFYVDGYLYSMDAQAALVFLFVPAFQLVIPALLAVIFVIARVSALGRKRKSTPP